LSDGREEERTVKVSMETSEDKEEFPELRRLETTGKVTKKDDERQKGKRGDLSH
jgi:hypothetical protein